MYCPKCGKEIPEDARFCMHCGADLSGYKVEISPNINVSPKIEVKTSAEKKEGMCAICDKIAVVTCPKCGRTVCNYHFEDEWGSCSKCLIVHKKEKCLELTIGYERLIADIERDIGMNPYYHSYPSAIQSRRRSKKTLSDALTKSV